MKRLLLVNAFIILFVIISFKKDQQDSSSFVSGASLQRFKTKPKSNQELNFGKPRVFDRTLRVRRSNGTNNSNTTNIESTTSSNKDSGEGETNSKTRTVVYISGPIGFVVFIVCCVVGTFCR